EHLLPAPPACGHARREGPGARRARLTATLRRQDRADQRDPRTALCPLGGGHAGVVALDVHPDARGMVGERPAQRDELVAREAAGPVVRGGAEGGRRETLW